MITLAFFVSLLYLYFVLFFDAKKHPFGCFFFLVSLDSVRCYFWCFADSPVLLDGGHHREVVRFVKMLRYPLVSCRYPVFSVNACIYSTLKAFLVSTPWGFAPNPNLTCGAAGAGG